MVFLDKTLILLRKIHGEFLGLVHLIRGYLGKLKIHTSGNISSIDNVDKTRVREFAENVRLKIEAVSKPNELKTSNNSDKFDQLEKIVKLRDSGILTEEEFIEQKSKILNQ